MSLTINWLLVLKCLRVRWMTKKVERPRLDWLQYQLNHAIWESQNNYSNLTKNQIIQDIKSVANKLQSIANCFEKQDDMCREINEQD